MSSRQGQRVSVGRAVLGGAVLAAWGAVVVGAVLVSQNPLVGAVGGVLFTVPLISLWEWLVHGVLYHRGIPGLRGIQHIHNAGHHHALFPPTRYVQDGPQEFMRFRKPLTPFVMADNAFDNALTSWSQVALHFVTGLPTIILPAWLLTHDTVFLASCLGTLAFVSRLLAYVHGCIHTPRDRWIEHHGWFQWLDRHHYIHHIDKQANINFLLPLSDLLFGTLKTRLTDEEAAKWPPFEQAKPMAKDIPQAPKTVEA